jgi:thiamine-phosphate pyrophosphorylase
MPLNLTKPTLYLITGGATTEATEPADREFQDVLALVSAAVAAGIQLIQLREKRLSGRTLSDLTTCAVAITRGTATRLLVNDRADIAAAAVADGVHLTTRSLATGVVRAAFGKSFLIGASTHSVVELKAAREGGADFAVFGPVYETASKMKYGRRVGLESLSRAASEAAPLPVLAIGGISVENAKDCLRAGAGGVAGITLFADTATLKQTADKLAFLK